MLYIHQAKENWNDEEKEGKKETIFNLKTKTKKRNKKNINKNIKKKKEILYKKSENEAAIWIMYITWIINMHLFE